MRKQGYRGKPSYKPNRYNPNDPVWGDVHAPAVRVSLRPLMLPLDLMFAALMAGANRRKRSR